MCLDRHLGNLPADTAPAGYTCPACQECVFPPDNLVSPVADALKHLLQDVNWARAGLGMPLLDERVEKRPSFQSVPTGPRPNPEGDSAPSMADGQAHDAVIQFDHSGATGGSSLVSSTPTSRNVPKTLATSPLLLGGHDDDDDDKYRRRSPLRFLSRWWRSHIGPRWLRSKRMTKPQRVLVGLVIGLFAFITLMVVLSHFSGRSEESYDPMLDPMNNPNIKIGHKDA